MANLASSAMLSGGRTSAADRATFSWSDPYQRSSYLWLVGLTAVIVFSYWNMLSLTSMAWDNDTYSHGWIVPLIALFLLWSRRPEQSEEALKKSAPFDPFVAIMVGSGVCAAIAGAGYYLENGLMQGLGLGLLCLLALALVLLAQPFARVSAAERWTGVAILTVALLVRLYAARIEMAPLDRISFIVSLVGVFVMVGGWSLMRWAGPAVIFLMFMFPLPTAIERPMLSTLQKGASAVSTVVLQTMGLGAIRIGERIDLEGVMPLEVAEACSGLRMLTIFGAMCVALFFLIDRPWWDRLIILLSAIPIALVSNITRIVVTALLYKVWPESESAHTIIHDYAGYGMMFFAMGILWVELQLLSLLSSPEEGADLRSAAGVAPKRQTAVSPTA